MVSGSSTMSTLSELPFAVPTNVYVKDLADQYRQHISHLDNPEDPAQLEEEFHAELEWFHKQTDTMVDLIKDKSLKNVATKATKEFIDRVRLSIFSYEPT